MRKTIICLCTPVVLFLSAVALAQEDGQICLRVTFGVATKTPKQWDAKFSTEGGEVAAIAPESFEQWQGDTLDVKARSLTCTTRTGEKKLAPAQKVKKGERAKLVPQGPTDDTTDGVLIQLRGGAGTKLSLATNHGNFSLRPSDVEIGRPILALDGDVKIERQPIPTRLSNPETNDDFPAMAATPDGKVHVAWVSFDGEADEILIRTFDGASWSDPQKISEKPGEYYRPVLVSGKNGELLAAWSANIGGNWDICCRRLVNGTWKSVERLTTAPEPDIDLRSAAGLDGSVWLCWQSFRNKNSDVYAKVLRDGAWSEDIQVTRHPANDWEPAIAVDSSGHAWVAWDSYRNGNYDVFMRTIEKGTLGDIVPVAATANFEAHAAVMVDASDGIWIAYDIGGPDWGKDYSEKPDFNPNPYRTLGPLHTYRKLGLTCYRDGRWLLPSPDISGALPFPDFTDFKRYTTKGGEYFELPMLISDGAGRLWTFFRHNSRGFAVHINSVWSDAAACFDGKHWSPGTVFLNSGGRQEQRPSIARDGQGNIWIASSSDGREFSESKGGRKNSDIFVSMIPCTGPAAQPAALQPAPPAEAAAVTPDPDALPERPPVKIGNKTYSVYWGDFHRHTDISDCSSNVDGCIADTFRYARDAARLDFISITDHHRNVSPYVWWWTQKSADLFCVTNTFCPFYGYERSMGSGKGHRNVIYLKRGGMVVQDPDAPEGTFDTLGLWMTLKGQQVITIPHQLTSPWHDWSYKNPVLEPVLELMQGHRGGYEYKDAPRPKGLHSGGNHTGSFFWDALERGVKIGVIASSDHMSSHISYAAVLAEDCSRESIFDAIKKRRTYGSTAKIVLDFQIDGNPMGSEMESAKPPAIALKVRGCGPIARVDVIKNNEFVCTKEPSGRDAEFVFVDKSFAGDSYYYARVIQKDDNMAWSSPIWVKKVE